MAAQVPSAAHADPTGFGLVLVADKTQGHAEAGAAHHLNGRFEAAIAEYRKAYELSADPVFLFHIAGAYQALGHSDRALFFYRRFVETTAGEEDSLGQRAAAGAHIQALEAELGVQPGAALPGAEPTPAPSMRWYPANPREAVGHARAGAPAQDALRDETSDLTPLWREPWVWTAGAALVVAGTVLTILAVSGSSDNVPRTELGHWNYRP